MTDIALFPFAQYWWFYLAFLAGVLVLLALDLGVFHREAHEVSFREAASWSAVWVSLALAFNYGFYQFALWKFPQDPRLMAIPGFDAAAAAKETALEFLTGFIVEKSLSVDNIFVFVLIFNFFALPAKYQHRVLFFGILGALIFRAIFIVLGSALLQFHWVVWIFGLFLIASGLKIMLAPEKGIDPEKNPIIRLFRRFVPVTPTLHGQQFFVRLNGVLHATPLFVFVSNVFAILGLRALYFLLAGMMDRFYMLKYGLAVVLIFVGLKIAWLNGLYGGKFPITISLGFIAAVIVLYARRPARRVGPAGTRDTRFDGLATRIPGRRRRRDARWGPCPSSVLRLPHPARDPRAGTPCRPRHHGQHRRVHADPGGGGQSRSPSTGSSVAWQVGPAARSHR